MQKKSHLKKKIKKHDSSAKKCGFFFYLKRYVLLVFTVLVFFTATRMMFPAQNTLPSCANTNSCKSDLTVNIENNAVGTFEGKTVHPPKIDLTSDTNKLSVLGESTASGEKHIYVNLSTQTLVAYQGTTQVLKTLVATGKWGKTPTGNFNIWEKLISTRMAGGEGSDAYDLPNVPYVMYFYHDFGLHGAYWHDNYGHTMSHGCVNMRPVDAKVLFEWADGPSGNTPGTAVSICDQITSDNQCIQNNPVQ